MRLNALGCFSPPAVTFLSWLQDVENYIRGSKEVYEFKTAPSRRAVFKMAALSLS